MAEQPELHFLFANADQQVFRATLDAIDGLVVPGTVATYFRQGTGGFVLSLARPYVIDPRTPIFQFGIPVRADRPSHEALARVCGEAFFRAVKQQTALKAEDWINAAESFAQFQLEYTTTSADRFARYAALLDEPTTSPSPPAFILPTYLMVAPDLSDSELVVRMLEVTKKSVGSRAPVAAVAAIDGMGGATEIQALSSLIASVRAARVDAVHYWINDFRETEASIDEILALGSLVREHSSTRLVSMYGGFLSIALSRLGLAVVSSGIGYSESRDAQSLFRTGPVPARYYHPSLHAFLSLDMADRLADKAKSWGPCVCQRCQGRFSSVAQMTYQDLLAHFVYTRVDERRLVLDTTPAALADQLESVAAVAEAATMQLVPALRKNVRYQHLSRWADALRQLS